MRQFVRNVLVATFCSVTIPTGVLAQYISVKTVPVATGDQFRLFPSANLGMAGVFIALDDPLLDPFVNPAKGGRATEFRLTASPALYATENSGSGIAFPLSSVYTSGRWFGGGALAVQTLGSGTRPADWDQPNQAAARNTYVLGMLGSRLGETGFSLAGSVFEAGLDAVQGVNMLYAGSQNIAQDGNMLDFRLGLLGELGHGRSLEAVLLHNRYNMVHEVTYATRQETNLDRTRTWGVHLGYVAPLAGTDWRIGGILTANWKSHPKIPNYEIMSIPRDPGNSAAYNIGIGLARSGDSTTFGVDLIYEPIWSNTWAVADSPTATAWGWRIPRGGRTVDNDFSFTNFSLSIGYANQKRRMDYQLGMQLRSTYYRLKQWDYVLGGIRKQGEHWFEWTPSFGLSGRVGGLHIRYVGLLTVRFKGPGSSSGVLEAAGPAVNVTGASYDIIAAPGRRVDVLDTYGFTQQICISIPVRN
jgi:hypothetical protein